MADDDIDVDYDRIISGLDNVAPTMAAVHANANPQDAADAQQLSDASGIPSLAVYHDLKRVQAQYKASMASVMVRNNPDLADWVRKNDLAPAAANDDWGNLDIFTRGARIGAGIMDALHTHTLAANERDQVIADAFGAAFQGPLGEWAQDFNFLSPRDKIVLANYGLPFEIAARTTMGVFGAVSGVAGSVAKEMHQAINGDPNAAEQFGREIQALTEYKMMADEGRLPETTFHIGQLIREREGAPDARAYGAYVAGKQWFDARVEPPAGVHPLIDEWKTLRNQYALNQLNSDLANAVNSSLRERTPEMFEDLVQRVYHSSEIAISGDRVAALYGDTQPAPDDGLLGWVPSIETKLNMARDGGVDVTVPVKDWLSKVDPKLATELNDDIRMFPGGISNREASPGLGIIPDTVEAAAMGQAPREYKPIVDAPLPAARHEVAMEPMFSVGDRKLQLQEIPKATTLAPELQPEWMRSGHDFQLMDQSGNPVGVLNLSERFDGKDLHVDMISGVNGLGPRDFGPALMLDLRRQLKQIFPQAETISGFRVSGARGLAGTEREVTVRFDNPHGWEVVEPMRDILEGGEWRSLTPTTRGYVRPLMDRPEVQRQAIQAVHEELARIAPGARVEVADRLRTMRGAAPRGLHAIGRGGVNSLILLALESPDMIGTARHEAIHHLYRAGFLNGSEWARLEAAAKSQGWIDQFGIKERYPRGSDRLHLEEAVAEGYRNWADGRPVPPEVHPIFQKIFDLLDAIKQRLAQIFGREPTWQDLFEQIHSGEIGARGKREVPEPFAARPIEAAMEPEQGPELPPYKEILDRIRAESLGLDLKSYKRLMSEYDAQYARDLEKATKRAQAQQKQQQTAAWKQEWSATRDDVEQRLRQRPDLAADLFFSTQSFFGKKVPEAVRIRADDLTDEQKAALPSNYYAKKGLPADQLATLFGFHSGDAMVQALARLNEKPSYLEKPAIKLDDKVYTAEKVPEGMVGGTHSALLEDMISRGVNVEGRDADVERGFGYIDSFGRFVDSVEAERRGISSSDDLPSSDELARLKRLDERNRESATERFGRLVKSQTDKAMAAKHGDLQENIFSEAKDQALSEVDENRLVEEMHAVAALAGTAPIDKDLVKRAAREEFGKLPVGTISSDRLRATMGKHGRDAEKALINGDPASAVMSLQKKFYTGMLVLEAKKAEKALEQTEKLIKKYNKAVVKNVEPEYVNYIHQIMDQIGRPSRRDLASLGRDIGARGTGSLEKFVGEKIGNLRLIHISPEILAGKRWKDFDDISVDEHADIHKMIKTMDFHGREELKIFKQGEAYDLKQVRGQLISSLDRFESKPSEAVPKSSLGAFITAAHIKIEALFNRFDEYDPYGPWQQFALRDLIDGVNQRDKWVTDVAKKLRELGGDWEEMQKRMDNPLGFGDPREPGHRWTSLTRAQFRALMLNVGTDSNLNVLARGYGKDPGKVLDWVRQVATKDDWNFVQKIWDIFHDDIKDKVDTMYRSQTGGVAPEDVPARAIVGLDGKVLAKGGYYPLIPHKQIKTLAHQIGKETIEQEGFFPAVTPSGYTIKRTGAIYPVSLDLHDMPSRITQMLHDAALRPAVVQTGKIFGSKDVYSAISLKYGPQYADLLMPYLRDIANAPNYRSALASEAAQWSDVIRQNMISTLVGLNPGTILKHGPTALVQSINEVGGKEFGKAFHDIWLNPATKDLLDFVWNNSLEIQRRSRNWRETLGGTMEQMAPGSLVSKRVPEQFVGLATRVAQLRADIVELASKPVAFSDMLSAAPTWLAAWRKAKEAGKSDGDAVYEGDRAVRFAHGSSALTSRPAVLRGGQLMQWFASVYNFYSHMQNKIFEIKWRSEEAAGLRRAGDFEAARERFAPVPAMIFSYVIAPALIGAIVAGLAVHETKSWGQLAFESMIHHLGGGWIFARDVIDAALMRKDPSAGLLSTAGQEFTSVWRDLTKDGPVSREHAGRLIQDTFGLVGLATGVPQQVGRTLRFIHDVNTGVARPRTTGQTLHGLWRGTVQ